MGYKVCNRLRGVVHCGRHGLESNVGGEAACWEGIEERRFSKPVEWLIEGRN
jgi:hypothetical protein